MVIAGEGITMDISPSSSI